MTLSAASLEWAIDFVFNHSDGDLFPKVLESRQSKPFAASSSSWSKAKISLPSGLARIADSLCPRTRSPTSKQPSSIRRIPFCYPQLCISSDKE